MVEKPEKRRERRPDTAKDQQQANGGHVEKAETGPSEPILLRELPFTLQGYSSTNLTFPLSTALKLPPTLPVPISACCIPLLSLPYYTKA
jgi:gamma-tubulin complex component 3